MTTTTTKKRPTKKTMRALDKVKSFSRMIRKPLDPIEMQQLQADIMSFGVSITPGYNLMVMPLRSGMITFTHGDISIDVVPTNTGLRYLPSQPVSAAFLRELDDLLMGEVKA